MTKSSKKSGVEYPDNIKEVDRPWYDRRHDLNSQLRSASTKAARAFVRWGDNPTGPIPDAADRDDLKVAIAQHEMSAPEEKADDPQEDQKHAESFIRDHLDRIGSHKGYDDSIRHHYEPDKISKLRIRAEEMAEKRRTPHEHQIASIEEGLRGHASTTAQRAETRVNDTAGERASRELWGEALAERERLHPEELEEHEAVKALMAMSRSGANGRPEENASNGIGEAAARARMGAALEKWKELNPEYVEPEDGVNRTRSGSQDTQPEQPFGRSSEPTDDGRSDSSQVTLPEQPDGRPSAPSQELKRLRIREQSAEPQDTEMNDAPGADEA